MKRKKRPLDVRDREAIEEMIESHGWKLFARRVERVIDSKRRDLERDLPERDTAAVRGFLDGVRSVLGIPKILIVEAGEDPAPEPGERQLSE